MGEKVTFGRYRVLQRDNGALWELGSSAVGVTYKALDPDLQRPVALKVINSDLVADEVTRNRFLGEARAAAALRHSSIASIYQLGQDEEQFFYAMEFIEGQTLDSYVRRYGPMPLHPALHVAWQVCSALTVAAKQQLVHRDIKPAKIMIVADSEERAWPFVKLIDFGLARSILLQRHSDGTTPPDTDSTVPSMSSQEVGDGKTDARSDIYSLGCTLWYLLTGEAPLTGSLNGNLAQQPGNEAPWACRVWNVLRGETPTVSVAGALAQQPGGEPAWEKLESFPRRVRDLLRRMLRKEPWQRAASAIELQREIEHCSADLARREALAERIALPLHNVRQWVTREPWSHPAAIFGASAIGVVLALGYYWNSDLPPQSAPATATSDVVRAEDPATSEQSPAKEMWSYLGGWDEPFRSAALAPLLSFAEPVAASPAIIGAKSWLHAESIWDGVVAVQDNPSSENVGDRLSAASNSSSVVGRSDDKKLAVAASEDKKAAMRKGSTRGKSQVKKTSKRYSYANYAKRPQRRVTNRSKDQGFDPLRIVQQARYHIKRAIRRIF